MALEVGSEEWLDVPPVTGKSESDELAILAHIKNCTAEIHNAARQMDGGPGCPPLYQARARTQAMDENTLRVTKKKKTKTVQVVGMQKRKLVEESKPQTVIYIDDPPSDDHHSLDDSCPPGISPPAKRVRCEEILCQSAESRPQPNHPVDLWTTAQRFCKAPNLMVHSNALMEDTMRVDPNNFTIHVVCLSNLLFVMMPFQIRRVALGWEDLMLDGMMLTIAAMSAMTST